MGSNPATALRMPDFKKLQDATAFAKLLKRAGTSRENALPRVVERYKLTPAESRSIERSVWGALLG